MITYYLKLFAIYEYKTEFVSTAISLSLLLLIIYLLKSQLLQLTKIELRIVWENT